MKITKERSAEIRRDLLQSTASEIRRVGFGSITMAQIAANCDVTVSTITNRFRNKFDLVQALISEVIEPQLGEQFTARSRAFWAGDDHIPEIDSESMSLVSELVLGAVHTPQLRPIISSFLSNRSRVTAAFRDEAITEGRARSGVDHAGQIVMQMATLIGHSIASLSSNPAADALDQITSLTQMTLLDIPFTRPLPVVKKYLPRKMPTLPEIEIDIDETGRLLLDSSRAMFIANGYEASNLQEIARNVGMTTGSIYARFAGKADLMRVLMAETVGPESFSATEQTARRLPASGADSDDTLGAYIRNRLGDPRLGDQYAIGLVARDAARREPEVAKVLGPSQDLHLVLLADILRSLQTDGSFRSDLDAESFAWWVLCFPIGVNLLGNLFPASRGIDWNSILRFTTEALQTQPE